MNCCICQFSVRIPKNIHTETVGKPPVLISELVLQCTKGTNYVLTEEASAICKKCCEKLARYHKSLQIARKLRGEILELIHSPFAAKQLPLKGDPKGVRIDKFDGNIDQVEVEAAAASEAEALAEEADSETEIEALTEEDDIVTEVGPGNLQPEEEQHTFVFNNAESAGDEFHAVDLELDIENEIIINDGLEEHEAEEELPEPGRLIEHEHFFKEDTMSEFDEQMDGTIEYIISDDEEDIDGDGDGDGDGDDQEQDADSSGDFAVNIQCPSCPEKFNSRRGYNAHTKREHFPGYVCDQCGKTLQSYSGFIGHLQNHEPVKQFACPVCPERFSRKFRLKHHMAWHSGETPYQCDVCSKRFVHKVALYKHKMIHDNETKRLECHVCGFKTRTKAHLERHTRSHTGDKPFACPVCNKRFSQMYNMKAHLREHESPGTNRHRRFHCAKCTHTFINEQNYMSHIERDDCTAAMHSTE
ncbi:hypothetical protein KR018_004773 [Drosophila ironensis]|nr:hypothetical protein KR018_004773 [Drosophila ironensis]